MRPILLLALVTTAACSAPPVRSQTQATPAPAATPVAESARETEAAARADALVEDLKRREVAQAKADVEAPPPVPISASLPDHPPTSPSVTATPASPPTTDAPIAQPAPANKATNPERDEKWWKDQLHSLQLSLDEAQKGLAEANRNNLKYGYNDAQAIYKKQVAAVAAARGAIDQLHDDARRASVPPAWLR